MKQKSQISFPQNDNQYQQLDSDRQYDFRADQRWCETIKKEVENLKNVAFQIKDLFKNGKTDDENFKDVYEKLQERDFNNDINSQPQSSINQQILPNPPLKNQINKTQQGGGKSIFKNESNRNSNPKGSFSQNNTNNGLKQDQEDNKEDFKEIKNMLDKMTNEVQKSLIETQQLKQELKLNKGDRENLFNIDKNDWDMNYVEYQKRQDKNREEISSSQRKIHDMQNKRLAQKVQDLHMELQKKMQIIEQNEEEYDSLVKKIQVSFGILQLNYIYQPYQAQKDKEKREDKDYNMKEFNQYQFGNFIFDLKKLIVIRDLKKDKEPELFSFEYSQMTGVDYKEVGNRIIKVVWYDQDKGEELKIKFDNDQDMNKFNILLYILRLNYVAFSTNSFTKYFDHESNPYLHFLFDKRQDGGEQSRLEKSIVQGMQSNYKQDMYRNNQEKNMIDSLTKTLKFQMNQSEMMHSNMNKSAASPLNNSILDIVDMNQSRKNRSFTPVNQISANNENRQQEMYISKKTDANKEDLNYSKMNNEKYWEEKIRNSVIQNKNKKSDIKIEARDKFRQIFQIYFQSKNQKDQQPLDISLLDVRKSKKDFAIDLILKKNEETVFEIDLKQDQFENFYRSFKFFCNQNLQKQKEISKAIQDLKNGMIFLKYSRGSFSPHEKLFQYEEQDKRPTLISRKPSDANGKDKKVTYFSDINSFSLGWDNGPGFKKFQKDDKRIIKELCLVIQLNNSKTIEVLAKTQQQRDQFYSYLNTIHEQVKLINN
ncbi:hypothetical protein TTHERM_00079950 (macronuclear) [Tetrahymena thermophila SB210]|uniref:Uncharacterized protein n=1 Tax=Tetrahymena thermophila (strain SB210) TaxID=312017 RepID=Q23FM0_TETTS|nr:hypothetical protein TTHERM_00079950 [Tetrahymena thermophila SB210]EAR95590.1 hypothetical protein TTHERM_00079950 [Tetrahymena thermophila SB210]|eukprot:XP_001015835.1 hypothetical protein TTHERM_00079950 [Tetrahymena thermophila SB210]